MRLLQHVNGFITSFRLIVELDADVGFNLSQMSPELSAMQNTVARVAEEAMGLARSALHALVEVKHPELLVGLKLEPDVEAMVVFIAAQVTLFNARHFKLIQGNTEFNSKQYWQSLLL